MHGTLSIRRSLVAAGVAASLVVGAFVARTSPASAQEHEQENESISCTLDFTAEFWSFLVGKGRGEGHIRCNNGQEADAVIEAKSVGIAVGEMKVEHGKGVFGDLSDIDEAFGRYASSSGGAAAGKTAAAGGLLKIDGEVKLGFYATGEQGGGIDVRSWGIVTIARKE